MTDRATFFATEPWTAGVIGLGYVGLPLAVNAARRGLRVIGFDRSSSVVDRLQAGSSTVDDVSDDELQEALANGLVVTSDEDALAGVDAVFICVPSPLNRHRQPDLTFIEAAAATVTRIARSGLLVALESTTYPGTTEDLIAPAATAGGLVLDRDVFVCFSPERISPGSGVAVAAIPKVVGGVSATSGEVGAAAYGRLVDEVHLVSSARAAEMTKLLENTYRAVNIALVNEMAQLSHELGIDVWEVIAAAATKPFGFAAFYPGPGVGGHCIPLDPQYLAWRAKEAGFATRFIDLAEQINTRMPDYVVDRVASLLNDRGLPVFGTRVLAVGIAYKPNVADARESPASDVVRHLLGRGAEVVVWDPMVPAATLHDLGFTVATGPDAGTAVAIVLTDHDAIDYPALAAAVPVVFDARGAYSRRGIVAGNVVAL